MAASSSRALRSSSRISVFSFWNSSQLRSNRSASLRLRFSCGVSSRYSSVSGSSVSVSALSGSILVCASAGSSLAGAVSLSAVSGTAWSCEGLQVIRNVDGSVGA